LIDYCLRPNEQYINYFQQYNIYSPDKKEGPTGAAVYDGYWKCMDGDFGWGRKHVFSSGYIAPTVFLNLQKTCLTDKARGALQTP
jgi:hypothetical protein